MLHKRAFGLIVVVVAMLASACVWPVPLPGDPVPGIQADLTYSAADGTLTVSAAASNIVPVKAIVWPAGFAGPATTFDDASLFAFPAPWDLVVDVGGLASGMHEARVMLTDNATYVTLPFPFEITGCNGSVSLCQRSYADVAYATAHNAMSSATDGWIGPNQQWDVPAQLTAGVRALMLDTYRAGDLNAFGNPEVPGVDPDTGYLCHALCVLGSQPLADGLGEIADFLDANPGEVVSIIIETYLDNGLTHAGFETAGLLDDVYVHLGATPWPTLGELVDAGTRLVVFQDRSTDATYPYLHNIWQHAFETHFTNAVPADFSCDPNRGNIGNELFILNHFLTEVFGSPTLAAQVNHNPLLIDRAIACGAVHNTMVNFVTVDFVDIGDTLATVAILNE